MSEMKPYKDCTIKVVLEDAASVLSRLRGLNAEFVGLDQQKDSYFKTHVGRLKLRTGIIENFITHYLREEAAGVERTTVMRYDVNPTDAEITEFYRTNELIAVVEKERKIFFVGNVKVHMDKLINGAEFLELEAIDRNDQFSEHDLSQQCFQVLDQLGLSSSMILKTGYFNH